MGLLSGLNGLLPRYFPMQKLNCLFVSERREWPSFGSVFLKQLMSLFY